MRNKTLKPYNITDLGLDAEINMYGEVVERHPVDWWTGEPVSGEFIALDDFLRDLDGLKDKNNITVHINSVGGDLYAGISIYNRLKSLPANIITVNDGLAASAGSIIFQAGNTRKVNAGSNIMVHQAMGLLYGYYQTNDLKQVIKQLDAGNKAAVNIYAEASGRDAESMKALVDKETWLTGQEAVDAGLADEVIESETPVSMSLTADRSHMIVNGISLSTRGMSNIPKFIPVMPKNTAIAQKNINERTEKMEIKNIDELRTAFPELIAQLENTAKEQGRANGIAEERSRIKGIEEIQNAIADQTLIASAKYGETPLTAEQLAFKAMQAQAAIGANMLTAMSADAQSSGTSEVEATPNGGNAPESTSDEEKAKQAVTDAVNAFKMLKNGGIK